MIVKWCANLVDDDTVSVAVGLGREGIISINSVNIFRGLLHQSVHIFKVLAALVSLGGEGPHGVTEAAPDLPGKGVRPDDLNVLGWAQPGLEVRPAEPAVQLGRLEVSQREAEAAWEDGEVGGTTGWPAGGEWSRGDHEQYTVTRRNTVAWPIIGFTIGII